MDAEEEKPVDEAEAAPAMAQMDAADKLARAQRRAAEAESRRREAEASAADEEEAEVPTPAKKKQKQKRRSPRARAPAADAVAGKKYRAEAAPAEAGVVVDALTGQVCGLDLSELPVVSDIPVVGDLLGTVADLHILTSHKQVLLKHNMW